MTAGALCLLSKRPSEAEKSPRLDFSDFFLFLQICPRMIPICVRNSQRIDHFIATLQRTFNLELWIKRQQALLRSSFTAPYDWVEVKTIQNKKREACAWAIHLREHWAPSHALVQVLHSRCHSHLHRNILNRNLGTTQSISSQAVAAWKRKIGTTPADRQKRTLFKPRKRERMSLTSVID